MPPTIEPLEPAIDLRDLLWKLRRRSWLLALPIIACLCGAAVYYKFTTPLYTSRFTISVDETGTAPAPAVDPLVGAVQRANPRDRVAVVDMKIHSPAFLGVLVERLGMNRNPELLLRANLATRQLKGITPEEYAMRVCVGRLGSKISVSPGRSSLIQIATVDPDPQDAKQLAEMIGDALLEASRQSTMQRFQKRDEFSIDQIAVYEDRLRKSEEAFREFQESRLRRGFSSGAITDQNLMTARNLERSTEDAMEQIQARIEAAKDDWRASIGPGAIPDLKTPHISEAIEHLGQLETSYGLALLRSGADGGGMQARVAAARQLLYADLEQAAQALRGNFSPEARAAAAGIALDRAVLSSLTDRRDSIAAEIAAYLKSVESSPRDEMQYQRLKQDVEVNREFLASLRREATSSRISEALASSSLGPRLEIVEHPLLPLQPTSPEPRKIFGLAVVLGPLLGVGTVFAIERLSSVVESLEQAEAEFGHKVIGTVPRIEGWARPGSYFQNHWPAMAIVLVLLLTGVAFVVNHSLRSQEPTTSQNLGFRQ